MKIELLYEKFQNFMSFSEYLAEFNGKSSLVEGRNGAGKSSLLNGYLWCLFDCDSDLHFNPSVRRMMNGQMVNDIDTFVELGLLIDGVETIVRKVQHRKFSKDGTGYADENTYYWNEVPITMKEFNRRFGMDMKTFLLCTNSNFFLLKKEKEMREYLFQKMGDISILDIAKGNDSLCELIPLLQKYRVEEIEALQKSVIANAKKEIPVLEGQIKEKERDVLMVGSLDLAEMELYRNSIQEQIKETEERLDDTEKAYAAYRDLSDGVLELKFKLSDLQRTANESLEQQRRQLRSQINERVTRICEIDNSIKRDEMDISSCEILIKAWEESLNSCLQKWESVKEETLDKASVVCPTCHRELPEEEIEVISYHFEIGRAERLADIKKEGLNVKKNLQDTKKKVKDILLLNKQRKTEKKQLQEELAELQERFNALPDFVDISETEEYQAIQKQIEEKEAAMEQETNFSEKRLILKEQLIHLRGEKDKVSDQIAKADTAKDEERLKELRESRLDLEQTVADGEKILDLLAELEKGKNEAMTDGINGMFSLVRWKLFDFNKNGGYKSVCVPLVDGKSILDIASNKGNRILGRLDIINSIQKMEGINCPVFLDDVESLDDENIAKAVEILGCQAILLQVNNEDELKVEEVR